MNLATGLATGGGTDVVTAVENVVGTWDADRIIGDENANRLFGEYGSDEIMGLGGDDVIGTDACCDEGGFTLDGGAGDDWLVARGDGEFSGGPGDDRLSANGTGSALDGGPGVDVADYTYVFAFDVPSGGTTESMEVDLSAGTAHERDCGTSCGQDTLAGIEGATGGRADDRLIGDELANALSGGDGNDEIVAAGGDDVLDGGRDFFDGDDGDGGAGNDVCKSIERPVDCESTG